MEYKYRLNESLELFINDKEIYCTSSTVLYYKRSFKLFQEFLQERLGKNPYLDDVRLDDLKDFLSWNLNRSNRNHDGKVRKVSINTYQRAIRAFFRYCYMEELMSYDIFSRYKMIKPEKVEKIPLFSQDVAAIDKLFSEKTEMGQRNKCIFHLMLDEGLRLNEVVALKIKDVNFEKRYILVNGKGEKQRIIPLTGKVSLLLKSYLVKFRRISRDCPVDNYKSDSLFLTYSREPITEHTIQCVFRKLKNDSGINVYPHLLRHTFATSYMMMGGDIESLRLLLGHEDLKTTEIYLHLANKYLLTKADVYQLDSLYFRKLGV